MILRTENLPASGHQRLNFDGSIYIRYAAPPYSAGTVIISKRVTGFDWVPFSELGGYNEKRRQIEEELR